MLKAYIFKKKVDLPYYFDIYIFHYQDDTATLRLTNQKIENNKKEAKRYCIFEGCQSNDAINPELSFFIFPKDEEM